MSEIIELRNTPKGQLQYSPHLNTVKLKLQLDQLSPPPLSRFHEEKESCKLNLSFGLDSANFGGPLLEDADFNDNCTLRSDNSSYLKQTVHLTFTKDSRYFRNEEKSDGIQEGNLDICETLPHSSGRSVSMVTPTKSPASFTMSPEFGYSSCAIVDTERKWDLSTQLSMCKRQAEFEHHNRCLSYLIDNKEKETLARWSQQISYRQLLIDRKLQKGVEEGHKRRQRLKEDHEQHQKRINNKQMEIEKQREMLKEEERKRKEKISKLHKLWVDIDSNRQTYIHRHDEFRFKSSLPELVDKYRAVLERICLSLAAQVQMAENLLNIDELITRFEEDKQNSCHAINFLEKKIEETEQKITAEVEKQKNLERKKAEEVAEVKKQQEAIAQDVTVQSLAFVLKEYEAKSKVLAQVEAAIRPFVENAQNKSFRFSIQRAVNTPINAISDFSGPHLMDKLKKLKELLHGQIANLSGNPTPGSVPPDVLLFCQNLIAKMLVKKGEEQVTSKHESAFPISTVVVALWEEFPVIGELFLAHLQALCPYVLPMYHPRRENQSSIDYHKLLGYKVSGDGTIEEQNKFLRRMSGLMRLYCSCMVAHLPPGVNSPHPQGLGNAWMWLARTMNLEPHPDVTAALIFDVLSVTGHALFKEYRVQFAKLLHLLYRSYLPKLESVSVTSATVGRLKIFVDASVKNSSIPPPEGLLPANFFFKPPDQAY